MKATLFALIAVFAFAITVVCDYTNQPTPTEAKMQSIQAKVDREAIQTEKDLEAAITANPLGAVVYE